jgi:hypothetical protein
LLVVADEAADADACKELLGQSRDYLTAVISPPTKTKMTGKNHSAIAPCILQVLIETQRRAAEKDRFSSSNTKCSFVL